MTSADLALEAKKLKLKEISCMNELQNALVVSDNAVMFADVANEDIPAAIAFLRRTHGPDQPDLL